MFQMPTSSDMITRIFGFFSCALAVNAVSARASAANGATIAIPAVLLFIFNHLLFSSFPWKLGRSTGCLSLQTLRCGTRNGLYQAHESIQLAQIRRVGMQAEVW